MLSASPASDDAGSGTEGVRAAFMGQPLADTSWAGVGLLWLNIREDLI